MAHSAELWALWMADVGPGHGDTLTRLLARYSEPHRFYHGVEHVVRVRRRVGELLRSQPVCDVSTVCVAGWFHDAVYDVRRSDNEAASAALARRELVALGWSSARVDAVERLILVTAGHTARATDEAVVVDADLSVLGGDPAEYEAYRQGVRFEYAHIDDDGWRTGRSQVLQRLLAAPAIFTIDTDREPRARANLTAELSSLDQ